MVGEQRYGAVGAAAVMAKCPVSGTNGAAG